MRNQPATSLTFYDLIKVPRGSRLTYSIGIESTCYGSKNG
jgi:hypothetical protein